MTFEEVNQLLKEATYKTAKTMPTIPHAYTLRYGWNDQGKFEEVVQFIRDNGVAEKFFNKEYIYYYLDGYKYWTMGFQLHITKLINRAKS